MPKEKKSLRNPRTSTATAAAARAKTVAMRRQRERRKAAPIPKRHRSARNRLYANVGAVMTLGGDFVAKVGPVLDSLGQFTRRWASVLILPCCAVAAIAFFRFLGSAAEQAAWKTESFWFFTLGCVLALVQFLYFARPVVAYVFGHELTHLIFAVLCFGKVHEFKVTRQGGFVVVSKNNWLISLSPYFFPIYAVAASLLFWAIAKKVDLEAPIHLGWTLLPYYKLRWITQTVLGALWGFHMAFTVWMIRRSQPDLVMNQLFFSLNVIVLVNLAMLCAMLALATPNMGWGAFVDVWQESGKTFLQACGETAIRCAEVLRSFLK